MALLSKRYRLLRSAPADDHRTAERTIHRRFADKRIKIESWPQCDFAKGIADSRILSRRLSKLVVGALVVMAVARLVPLGAVQFYVQGVAGIVALWPLAYEMWNHPEARPARKPRPMPAA